MISEVPSKLLSAYKSLQQLIKKSTLIKKVLDNVQCADNYHESPFYLEYLEDCIYHEGEPEYCIAVRCFVMNYISLSGFVLEDINSDTIILSYKNKFLIHIWYKTRYEHDNDIYFHEHYDKVTFPYMTNLYYYDDNIRITDYYQLVEISGSNNYNFFHTQSLIADRLKDLGFTVLGVSEENIWVSPDTGDYCLICMGFADSKYPLFQAFHWVDLTDEEFTNQSIQKIRTDSANCVGRSTHFSTNTNSHRIIIPIRPSTDNTDLANALLSRVFIEHIECDKDADTFFDIIIEAENYFTEIIKNNSKFYYVVYVGEKYSESVGEFISTYQLHCFTAELGDKVIFEVDAIKFKLVTSGIAFILNLFFTSKGHTLSEEKLIDLLKQGLSIYYNILPKSFRKEDME